MNSFYCLTILKWRMSKEFSWVIESRKLTKSKSFSVAFDFGNFVGSKTNKVWWISGIFTGNSREEKDSLGCFGRSDSFSWRPDSHRNKGRLCEVPWWQGDTKLLKIISALPKNPQNKKKNIQIKAPRLSTLLWW